jgi:hypothetical protein
MMIDLCNYCNKADNGCPIYPTLRITYKCVEFSANRTTLTSKLFNQLQFQNVSQLSNIQAEPPYREPASTK